MAIQSPDTGAQSENEQFVDKGVGILRDRDASATVVRYPDGETEAFVVVREDLDGRERLLDEVFKSLAHAVGQRMNPIAAMVGDADYPPERIPRDEQPSLDEIDADADDSVEALRESDAQLIVAFDHEHVEWERPEGSQYQGGLGTADDDRDAAVDVLDATRDFATQ